MVYGSATDRQPVVIGLTSALIVIDILAVLLRFVSRRLAGAGLWADDWIILFTLVVAQVVNATTLVAVHDGEGKHEDVAPVPVETLLFHVYIDEIFSHLGITTVKFAILLLYGRIFAKPSFRLILWITGGAIAAWGFASVIGMMFRCTPVHKSWDINVPGSCVDLQTFLYGQSVPDVFFDLVIIVLPLFFIKTLYMPKSQKIALAAIFLLAVFVLVCSTIRLAVFIELKETADISWNLAPSLIWSTLEINVGLIVACLMTCGTLLKLLMSKLRLSTSHAKNSRDQGGLVTVGSRTDRITNGDREDLVGFARLNDEGLSKATAKSNLRGSSSKDSSDIEVPSETFQLDEIVVRHDVEVSHSTDRERQ